MRAKLGPLRYLGPVILAFGCLIAAYYVSPVVAYVLVIAAFVLMFEGSTAWFARAGATGGLKSYRQ